MYEDTFRVASIDGWVRLGHRETGTRREESLGITSKDGRLCGNVLA
jgi:hypothetical protein